MKKADFLDALGRVDEDLITECLSPQTVSQKKPRRMISALVPAAACFFIVICAVIFVPRIINTAGSPVVDTSQSADGETTTASETSQADDAVESGCVHGEYSSYHSIDYAFFNYVGADAFEQWLAEKEADNKAADDPECPNKYTNIVQFIRDFGITRDVFDSLYTNAYIWYSYIYDADVIYSGADAEIEAYFRDIDARNKDISARSFELHFKQLLCRYVYGDDAEGLINSDAIRSDISIIGLISDGLTREQYETAYNTAFRDFPWVCEYKYAELVSDDLYFDDSMSAPELDEIMRGDLIAGGYEEETGARYNTDGTVYSDGLTAPEVPAGEQTPDDIAPAYETDATVTVDGVCFTEDMSAIITHDETFTAADYTVPDTVTRIANSAFAGCAVLESVYIPDSVTNIEAGAFTECTALRDVRLPSKLTRIEQSVFHNCLSLETIVLPDTIDYIGFSAFCYDSKLTEINLPEGLAYIGLTAFMGTGLVTVTLPASLETLGDDTFNRCVSLEAVYVADGSENFSSDGGMLYNRDKTVLIKCPAALDVSELSLRGVSEIKAFAFMNCSNLKHITFDGTLEKIGEWAFYSCGLVAVEIPENVVSVGDCAFEDCADLSDVTLYDDSLKQYFINTPYYDSFAQEFEIDETGTVLIKYTGGGGSVLIPNGITTIGKNAFSLIQNPRSIVITDVYIPDTVTVIEDYAFFACDGAQDGLRSVRMSSYIESIGDGAFSENHYIESFDFNNVYGQKITFGADVFANCSNLMAFGEPEDFNYTFPDGNDIFAGTPLSGMLTSLIVSITDLSEESWQKLNYDAKITDQCREFFEDLLSGESDIPEYNALGITDWRITRDDRLYTYYPAFIFEFTVTGDSLDALEPGEYKKAVLDIRSMFMVEPDKIYSTEAVDYSDIPEAMMVTNYIWSQYNWNCYDFGKWRDYSGTVNYLVKYYQQGDFRLTLEDFRIIAERVFGIPYNTPLGDIAGLTYTTDGVEYIQEGGIGGGCCFKVVDVQKTNNGSLGIKQTQVGCVTKVTVQLYADMNALLPSHKLVYTIENRGTADGGWYTGEDGVFVSCEVVKESKYEPIGLNSIFEQ